MQYRIQLFAGMAEQLGQSGITLEFPQETVTIADIRKKLNEQYSEAASQLQGSFLRIIKNWLLQRNSSVLQIQSRFFSRHQGWKRSFQHAAYLRSRTIRLMPMR